MIVYSSMPIMFSSPSAAHDQVLLRQLRELALDSNNLAAVTSPMWAAQFLYQVGVKLPAVRPLAMYTRLESPDFVVVERAAVLMARSRVLHHTLWGIGALSMMNHMIDYMGDDRITLTAGWADFLSYKEIASHNAIVLVPHDPVMMAFYDYLALCVPIFLPSKRMMARLLGTSGYQYYWRETHAEARIDETEVNSIFHWSVSPLQAFSGDFLTRQYLVNLCSWYHTPNVLFFDSVVELFAHFLDPNWPMKSIHIRKQMQAHYQEQVLLVQDFYAHWLGAAAGAIYGRRNHIHSANLMLAEQQGGSISDDVLTNALVEPAAVALGS